MQEKTSQKLGEVGYGQVRVGALINRNVKQGLSEFHPSFKTQFAKFGSRGLPMTPV